MTKKSKKSNLHFYYFITFIFLFFSNNPLFAKQDKKFKEVEATGRAVLVVDDIQISRKRALEDALYLAALKGGADINGFSAITSNTVINDQSIVTATNKVIDFKILKEEQDKEFLSIKISAIVGGRTSAKKCKKNQLTLFYLKVLFIQKQIYLLNYLEKCQNGIMLFMM
jgi:hypothetical protein